LRVISPKLCVECKGHKYLCGLPTCPILNRFKSILITLSKINNNQLIKGSTPPSVIVGESKYPKVPVIVNIPPQVFSDEAKNYENPKEWWGRKSLSDIISLRSSLVSNIIESIDINNPWILYNKEISLTAISLTPISSESRLRRIIQTNLKFDGKIMPTGISGIVDKLRIEENPKISKIFEKLVFDDIKSFEAVIELYKNKEDYYKIINAFSLGLLGTKKRRKLVPTRWAITAIDSILGNYILNKIKYYDEINEILLHKISYLGNNFYIILYPSKFRVNWIEIWYPLTAWTDTEFIIMELEENYWGEYDLLDGGYMAARVSLLEYLESIKKQAGAIIIREITPSYYAPVGNWHIRESVKHALNDTKPIKFDSLKEALSFINSIINKKINLFEIKSIKKLLSQRNILDYLSY
jgi:hypothetical protein